MSQIHNSARVHFVTLGCAKNEVDSAHMQARTEAAGFLTVDDPAEADAIVINTCSFIQAATEESLEMIFDMLDISKEEPRDIKLIVSGCMPSRYGTELEQELPEVNTFIPCSKEEEIVDILAEVLGVEVPSLRQREFAFGVRVPTGNQVSAYVKISDGCDRFCTYCTIPFIRGRYHSFSYEHIEAEVDALITDGVREIVLIAQDTGRWGSDFDEPSSLARLLATLAEKYPHTWFRVMYIQPEGVSDELLSTVAHFGNICSYFDIPLQQVSTALLAAMNRTGGVEEFEELLERIRHHIPDATIRTTLIAGFPGESEEEFEQLCAFIEEAEFDYVGVFPYSQEEGTKAARMANQVEETLKLERAQILRDIADQISTLRVAQRIGHTYPVLVLGYEEDGQLYGRAQCQAPDVDGVVYLESGLIGEIKEVVITDTLLYEMEGEVR